MTKRNFKYVKAGPRDRQTNGGLKKVSANMTTWPNAPRDGQAAMATDPRPPHGLRRNYIRGIQNGPCLECKGQQPAMRKCGQCSGTGKRRSMKSLQTWADRQVSLYMRSR